MPTTGRRDAMRHRVGVAGCLRLAAGLAASCGGGGEQQGGGGGQQGGGAGRAVIVTEHEWAIQLPSEIPSGAVTFSVKNDGAVEHNFVIQETEQRLDGIPPGQTTTLEATPPPGTHN